MILHQQTTRCFLLIKTIRCSNQCKCSSDYGEEITWIEYNLILNRA